MKERYIVEIDRPPGMTRADMVDYLTDAASGWKGGYEGDHPLVGKQLQVRVVAIPKTTELQLSAETTPWGQVALSQLPRKKP